jgi:hypothetical protein
MTVRGYTLAADWSGAGTYTGTLEDVTGYVLDEPTLYLEYGRERSSEPAPAGTLTFGLNNQGRQFSSENVSSPIADLVLPGTPIRLTFDRGVLASDVFTRTPVSNGWGTATSGMVWNAPNVPTSFSTNGTQALMLLDAVNARRMVTLPVEAYDVDIAWTVATSATAAGGQICDQALLRNLDSDNHYYAGVGFSPDGTVVARIEKRVLGSNQTLATILTGATYTPGTAIGVHAKITGSLIQVRAWNGAEPTTWDAEWRDTSLTAAGAVGFRGLLVTGNSNGLPVTLTHDNVVISYTPTVLADVALDDFKVNPDRADRAFEASCVDRWGRRPRGEKLSTELYQGLRTGDAMHIVLDAIGWPTDARDIDPGATWIQWWWEEDIDAPSAIEKLVDSEGPPAIAYVEGGVFVFRDRHHRLTRARSQVSQGTYTHAIPAGSGPVGSFKFLQGFAYDDGLRNLVNSVEFTVEQRAVTGFGRVWTSEDMLTVENGDTVAVKALSDNPFFDAIPPEQDVDYELVSGSVSVALSRTSGQSATIFITAIGGPAVIASLSLRGSAVTVARSVKVHAEDTTSISRYRGTYTWERGVPWANPYDAQAIADYIVTAYSVKRPVVTFELANLDATYLGEILDRRVSDRVTIRNDEMGLNGDFHIERIGQSIRKHGLIGLHLAKFVCQSIDPGQPANAFRFDVAGAGFNDGAFSNQGISDPATMFIFDVSGRGFNQGVFAT